MKMRLLCLILHKWELRCRRELGDGDDYCLYICERCLCFKGMESYRYMADYGWDMAWRRCDADLVRSKLRPLFRYYKQPTKAQVFNQYINQWIRLKAASAPYGKRLKDYI